MPAVAPTPFKATPKAPMSYLDLLPDDIIDIIYKQVVADTTDDIEAKIKDLEESISIITFTHQDTPYLRRMLTFNRDNINKPHAVYDNFLHISPEINLYRRINADKVEIHVSNVWQLTVHSENTGLVGHIPEHITLSLSKDDIKEPITNFTVIDEIMRYALGFGISLENRGWLSNCINDVAVHLPYNDDDDDDDDNQSEIATNTDYTAQDGETVRVWVSLWKSLNGVGYDRTHKYSTVTLFEDEE